MTNPILDLFRLTIVFYDQQVNANWFLAQIVLRNHLDLLMICLQFQTSSGIECRVPLELVR